MTNWAARSLAIAVLCLFLSPAEAASLTVNTSCNTYTGISDDGVAQWLGIRYAAPPVGDLRFMPPQNPSCSDGVQLPDNTVSVDKYDRRASSRHMKQLC